MYMENSVWGSNISTKISYSSIHTYIYICKNIWRIKIKIFGSYYASITYRLDLKLKSMGCDYHHQVRLRQRFPMPFDQYVRPPTQSVNFWRYDTKKNVSFFLSKQKLFRQEIPNQWNYTNEWTNEIEC